MRSHNNNQKRRLLPLSYLIIGILLTGCAAREKPVLSLTAKQSMKTAKLVVINDHSELEADIQGSNSTQVMGGGLLWALADAAAMAEQTHSQSKVIAPIKAEVKSINLITTVKNEISQTIPSLSKFHFSREELKRDEIENYISSNQQGYDGIGILTPQYKFSEDFATLKTTMQVDFYPTSKTFKTALGVSDAFNAPAIDTRLHEETKPVSTLPALPDSTALKKQAKDKLSDKLVFASTIEAQKLITEEKNRIRETAKTTNAKIWSENNGLEIKKAITNSTNAIIERLKTTLATMFPDGIDKIQTSKVSE